MLYFSHLVFLHFPKVYLNYLTRLPDTSSSARTDFFIITTFFLIVDFQAPHQINMVFGH